ncbi:MAG TPA: response regulator [Terriglobales bacterium]|nr:response regulator [Terriglobales bacterium]
MADVANKSMVLCVDDDLVFLQGLVEVLMACRCDVAATSDVKTALELVRREPVSLAIVDCEMPAMPGAALASAMRRIRPEMAIILLSSSSEATTEGPKPADKYVTKASESRQTSRAVSSRLQWSSAPAA